MSHTDPDALVRDYLTADGTLDHDLVEQQLFTRSDEQLADEVIAWGELDRRDGDEPSWLERHADRDDLIASIAMFRRYGLD